MRLFKPKAPSIPEGATYQFRFASDNTNPDGTPRALHTPPQVDEALTRIVQEIGRLRTVIADGANLPHVDMLSSDLASAKRASQEASDNWGLARRRYSGGVIDANELSRAAGESRKCTERFHKLGADLQRRRWVDEAESELSRILAAIR